MVLLTTPTSFVGVGEGVALDPALQGEVDVINFVGDRFTPQSMVLTQIGNDVLITFNPLPYEADASPLSVEILLVDVGLWMQWKD